MTIVSAFCAASRMDAAGGPTMTQLFTGRTLRPFNAAVTRFLRCRPIASTSAAASGTDRP